MKNTLPQNESNEHNPNLVKDETDLYVKKFDSENKRSLIIGIVSLLIALAVAIVCIILCVQTNEITMLFFYMGAVVICIGISLWLIISSYNALHLPEATKINKYIERETKKQQNILNAKFQLKPDLLGRIDTSVIKSVIILDSYTEMSDKLHAILNYQEIIQTRYYKFRVNYFDGSSKIITAKEDSPEYNALIGFVGQDASNNTYNIPNKDNADLILKYKKFLDEGIITQEEFDKKKKELL